MRSFKRTTLVEFITLERAAHSQPLARLMAGGRSEKEDEANMPCFTSSIN